ncbi:hypothetical protein WME97_45455 [Sorangium sp. So ce367]|uniref:hypothetical protein n=1 Tax=Sorangium sp. So ce367 TaxID=3133305 RepID=UPI003F6367E9
MSRVVARGAIRVDARRAVQKLREHLLVDLDLYLLELVRAAAAGGATQIDLRYDADDVVVTFDGDPPDGPALERLLDHVLNAAPDAASRRLRLLALGVNAALGLRPARVDLLTTGPSRKGSGASCTRVRFTPDLIEAPAEAPAPAAGPACDEVPRPPGMPAAGLRIEVRRRLGWSVLRRAITGDSPPELAHLAAATGDFPIPIALAGEPLRRALPSSDLQVLVRVPFHVRGARRAALEIVAPPEPEGGPASSAPRSRPLAAPISAPLPSDLPVVDYLERGVRLVRERWSFDPRFPSAPYQGVELPVRVVVDADALPTNASRSAVREDAPLRARLREAAAGALLDAIQTLAALVCGEGAVPDGALVVDEDSDRLADALAAFACVATGAMRAGAELPAEAQAVRELPLLRDGRGRPTSLAALDAHDAPRLFLFRGDARLPKELAPWAGDVVWSPGGLVERALAGLPLADAEAMIEQVKLGAERRRAFLLHATGDPVVPPSPEHAFRDAFQVDEGPLAGLRGELAVFADAREPPRGAEVRVFVDGRHLETVELDPAAVPLPVEIALAWKGRVRPRFAYDGVERDARFWRAVRHALKLAIAAADREAKRLFSPGDAQPGAGSTTPAPAPESELARVRPALRAAIGAAFCAPLRLGAGDGGPRRGGGAAPPPDDGLAPERFEGLLDARIWPTFTAGLFVSVSDLSTLSRAARGICTAPPGARGHAADRRLVLAVSQRELDWLAAALPERELVPYGPGLFTEDELAARGPARRHALAVSLERLGAIPAGAPVLEVSGPGFLALATPSDAVVEVWHHASRPLATLEAAPLFSPAAIAIDDDTAAPNSRWDGLLSPRNNAAVHEVERALLEALVAALEGDAAARARLGLRGDPLRERGRPDARVSAYLLDSAHALQARARAPGSAPFEAAPSELAARIRRLPLLGMLDARGQEVACSLETLDATHPAPAPIPVLDAAPGFETLSWHPLVARNPRERAALMRWAGGRALLAQSGVPARRQRAAAEQERRASASKAQQEQGPRGAAGQPRAPLALPGAPSHPLLRVSAAALGVQGLEGEIEIVEGPVSDARFVGPDGAERRVEVELPIPLRLLVRAGAADPSRDASRAILTRLAKAAGRHLIALAPRFDELPPFARGHARRAVLKTLAQGKRVVAEAARAPLFHDIEGNLFSLDDLRRDPRAEWLCTSTPPPYPKQRYERPVLALSRPERLQLATAVIVKDITDAVARDRAAEERLTAPPLAAVGLDAAARAACFAILPFEQPAGAQEGAPPAHGEIGLLAPEHAGAAGIAVHVGRRPLCALDAGDGWPLCAAVNDDALEPNRAFDGLKGRGDASRLRQAVRDAAARWLRARLAPPGDALATRWIDVATTWPRPLFVIGALWLPARWPRAPEVLVAAPSAAILGEGGDGGGFTPVALRCGAGVGPGTTGVAPLAPVEGRLLVWPPREARWDAIAELAMEAAASMAAELSDQAAAAPYLWNLHLLGRLSGGKLAAQTASGESVGPAAIRAELAASGCLWITDRRGSADGDFPDGSPPFVLLDDGSPLVEVLRHRAAPGALRELGALAATPAPAVAIAEEIGPASGTGLPAAGARGAEAPVAEAPAATGGAEAPLAKAPPDSSAAEAPAAEAPPDSSGARAWAIALWRSVLGLLGGEAAPVPGATPAGQEAAAGSPLAAALHEAIVRMNLEGSPVRAVVEGRSGRPIRYDASRSHIVVNTEHEALAWLRARGAPDPAAVALLAAAAVGEVNRALRSVTDAEERRALDHLLRSIG